MARERPRQFTDEFEKVPKYWEQFKKRVAIPARSAIYEAVKDLSRTRLVYDGCNAGVQVGDGGIVRFYRNKYCNPGLPVEPYEPILGKRAPELPQDYCGNQQLTVSVQADFFSYQDNINGNWYLIEEKIRITKIVYPLSNGQAYIEGIKKFKHNYSASYAAYQGYPYPPERPEFVDVPFKGQTDNYGQVVYASTGPVSNVRAFFGIDTFNNIYQSNFGWGGFNTYQEYDTQAGVYAYTLQNPSQPPPRVIVTPVRTLTGTIDILEDPFYGTYYRYTAPSLNVYRSNFKFYSTCGNYNPIPDPPPPPKEKEPMDCCTNIEQLLKVVLKKIGSAELPATVPNSLAKLNSGTKQIQSLAEFQSYAIKQMDALVGKYPFQIKIKDSDLTQEGEQPKTVNIPNVAEGMAEMIGMLLVLQSESNANLIATISAMVEAGSAKQIAILGTDYAKANSEFLGYKGKQIERDVPSTFKPGEGSMDKMLVAGQIKVKGFENDDKEDFNDSLAPLLELAAMWKAQNFKNLGTSNTLGKLKEFLTGALDISDAIDTLVKTPPPPDPNNPDAEPPEPPKSDFDLFMEEAEAGFTAQPGITDITNPYGRPLDQRPKIREIGMDTSDSED